MCKTDHGAPDGGPYAFLRGGGEMGDVIRAFDWSRTSLGPIESWPQSLKTATSLLLLSPIPIVLLWNEDGVMIYNDAYSGFAGNRHPQLLGSKVREGWPEVADFNDNVMRVGLAGGTLSYENTVLMLNRDGVMAPAWLDLGYSPVLDESGKPGGVIAIVVETTKRVLAEQQRRESEDRFRALVNATSDVIYRMNPDWTEMGALDGRGFLADTSETSASWQEQFLPENERPRVQAAIDKAIAGKTPFQLEHRVYQANGGIGWVFSRAVPLLDETGQIVEWFGAASDVTERHRNEEHLRLVVNELNHRVKNNLAMTQAIALQTFRDGSDLTDARERFAARMVALGQATDLLTGERWAGASLRGVIDQAVSPHCPDGCCPKGGRCLIDGPEASLSPKTALALSLTMHELATNAVKYGALSNNDGAVAVTWRMYEQDGERITIEWRESGGPSVSQPTKRGFGSRLIERGLAGEMQADVAITYAPEGLVCRIDAPLDRRD